MDGGAPEATQYAPPCSGSPPTTPRPPPPSSPSSPAASSSTPPSPSTLRAPDDDESTTTTTTSSSGSGRARAEARRRTSPGRQLSGIRTRGTHAAHLDCLQNANIKEEPRDEIKDYAETTMNELLGWYGYNDVIHKEDTLNLDLKRFAPNGEKLSPHDGSPHNSPGGSASVRTEEGLTSTERNRKTESIAVGGSSSLASKNGAIAAALTISSKKMKDERKKDPEQDSKDGANPLNMGLASPEQSMHDSDSAATSDPLPTLICAWCQKRAGEKPLSFKMDDGATKVFCTDLCFTMCRRASFKKSKVCDWCKKVKNTVSYVDFQDGEQQLQFCGEQCLNQYKMNIFCKETQSIKSQLGSAIVAPPDGAKQIIITPDLWTEQQRLDDDSVPNETGGATRSLGEGDAGKSYRDEKESSKRFGHVHKAKLRSDFNYHHDKRLPDGHAPYGSKSKLRYEAAANGEVDKFHAQRSLTSIPGLEKTAARSPKRESALYSSPCHRPNSKNSDGHVAKGSSSKHGQERVKLNHSSESFSYAPPFPLAASPGSDMSSTPRSSAGTATHNGGPLNSPSALPASHLLGCLGPGLQPWMYNPLLSSGVAGFPGFGLPGLGQAGGLPLRSGIGMASPPPPPPPPPPTQPPQPPLPPPAPVAAPAPHSTSNPSSQEKREPESTTLTGGQQSCPSQTASLPNRPPFSVPLPPNPTNLFNMLPPPGMPGLFPMAGPGLIPPGGGMNGLLPPNTLMVPYPVIVPLPIPLPLPIPIPVPCDKAGNPMLPMQPLGGDIALIPNAQIKQEETDVDSTVYPKTTTTRRPVSYQSGVDDRTESCVNTGMDRIVCACCNKKPPEGERDAPAGPSRKLESPPAPARRSPSNYIRYDCTASATSCQGVQNDAIDLSKDRRRPKADATSSNGVDLNRNNAVLRVSPSSSESDGSSHFPLGGVSVGHAVESVYSARRSLILDAPSTPKDRNRHSPHSEKRLYVGGFSKEHTYGKRRCMRPRIRTK